MRACNFLLAAKLPRSWEVVSPRKPLWSHHFWETRESQWLLHWQLFSDLLNKRERWWGDSSLKFGYVAHSGIDILGLEEEMGHSGPCLMPLAYECPPNETCSLLLPGDIAGFTFIHLNTLQKSRNIQKIIKIAQEKVRETYQKITNRLAVDLLNKEDQKNSY